MTEFVLALRSDGQRRAGFCVAVLDQAAIPAVAQLLLLWKRRWATIWAAVGGLAFLAITTLL
jgi:hypothetical protein